MTWAEEQARQERALRVAQAALQRRTATLKETRDYYEQKAKHPDTPKRERAQWQALADELTPRVGDRPDDARHQQELF